MSQESKGNGHTPHHGSSFPTNEQVQSLMNSLISPTLPLPGYSGDFWPGMPPWPLPFFQGPFPNNQPGQQGANDAGQANFCANTLTFNPVAREEGQEYSTGDAAQATDLSSAAPHTTTTSGAQSVPASKIEKANQAPTTDSKQRAAELRAQLLANRSGAVAPSVPAKEVNGQQQTSSGRDEAHQLSESTQKSVKAATVGREGQANTALTPIMPGLLHSIPHAVWGGQARDESSKARISAELDSLFAEARNTNDIDGEKKRQFKENAKNDSQSVIQDTARNAALPPKERLTSSDEEGEIRGESTQPTSVDQPDEPMKSIENGQHTTTDNQEKLLRQTETMIAYQNLKKGSNWKSGKDHGQHLPEIAKSDKEPNAIPERSQIPRSKPSSSNETTAGQNDQRPLKSRGYDSYQPTRDNPKPWKGSDTASSREDRYRQEDLGRRPSDAVLYAQKLSQISKEEREAVKRTAKENPPRGVPDLAANPKDKARSRAVPDLTPTTKEIATSRAVPDMPPSSKADAISGPPSTTELPTRHERVPSTSVASSGAAQAALTQNRVSEKLSNSRSAAGSSAEAQPTRGDDTNVPNADQYEVNDEDLMNWLEMTEYFDVEYRQRKLARFRKKRELDRQRAELEREEQLELEERSQMLRGASHTSTSNASASPHGFRRASLATPQMRPPPLPLRIATHIDPGINIKGAASSPRPLTPLKRNHAEMEVDSTVAPPAEKATRVNSIRGELSHQSPVTAVKGETHSAPYSPAVPLEPRTRPASPEPFKRLRSRSPRDPDFRARQRERDSAFDNRRPSSYSPRRAPYPRYPAERQYQKECSYCHELDHQASSCPLLARDLGSRDYDRRLGFEVSANYKGNHPVPYPTHGRGRGGYGGGSRESRSRVSSQTRDEDGERRGR